MVFNGQLVIYIYVYIHTHIYMGGNYPGIGIRAMLKHGETASQSNKQFHVPLLRGAPQNNLYMTI